jgi:hypothetical protein
MRLQEFVAWLKSHPKQSCTSIRNELGLRATSQVQNFLSQIEFLAESGRCPAIGRANVQLYTFVAMPEKPKASISTIRERKRESSPRDDADCKNRMIFQETVDPCVFPAMCYSCQKNRKHRFERVGIIGGVSIVKATCSKCGKETTAR